MINNYAKPQYHPSNLIMDRQGNMGSLYLGDIKSATDLKQIQKDQILTVITAAQGFDHLKYPRQITHIKYNLLDSKSQCISRLFENSYKVIQSARIKGNVLIHCAAGVSRSATLVIAYLMYKNTWSFKKAIQFVRQRRSIICPNLGFQMQLKQYQKYACKRSALNKSSIVKTPSILKRQSNLPQICFQKTRIKFKKYQRMSNLNVIKKSERDSFLQNHLNLPNNLRIVAIRTPIRGKSQQSRPFRRFKSSSSQLLEKFQSS